eukprot:365298-Chlamydomonas_euryale.AAC.8
MSEFSGSSASEGVEVIDPPASTRIKSINDVATRVTAAVGGDGCGRGQQKVWKCNGIFKKLTKVCGFERKGGQTKLLAHCLARYKPPGGRHGRRCWHDLYTCPEFYPSERNRSPCGWVRQPLFAVYRSTFTEYIN